ncbi:hypothetical protein CI105_02505 [Candidatus Izimaplasma bacterium ZiA1]|uniref:bifunctional adenosylcobinamide kinase/adenosylcobinamide-phosphate guanylyltransferase n=1 Tax=Candidatus Izimoplasma sp. ZiA1 TaxID=2024899 RepID=UPI000BAA50AE|nr:hypothetical protein CI105_02505 [Candidatus Izimaplasma bacterium ZiA1]
MVTFVFGGVRSSKSIFAEKILPKHLTKVYIATMINNDNENDVRINNHQSRRNKNWTLIEQPYNLDLIRGFNEKYVLLDCLTNLLANELFVLKKKPLDAIFSILNGILMVKNMSKEFVIVSNNIFEDGIEYFDETDMFLKTLGTLHQKIVEISDNVYEAEYGLYRKLKG